MRGQLLKHSCQYRCENDMSASVIMPKYCTCDSTCLFLGDCCYDYLMKCDPRNLSFDVAIAEQANIFRRYAGQSSCNEVYVYGTEYSRKRHIRIVDGCPHSPNTDVYDEYCRNENEYLTFANYVPIVAQGIPYLNIYCAACHGVKLKDIDPITEVSPVLCHTEIVNPEYILYHFYPNFRCESVTVDPLVTFTKLTYRIAENCVFNIDSPMRYCTSGKYMEECFAYKTAPGQCFTSKSDACKACSRDLNSTIKQPLSGRNPQVTPLQSIHMDFFKFIKTYNQAGVCDKLQFSGKPGNRCLVKKCQPGFRLHDGQCISTNQSTSCLEPHENPYSKEYNVADLFRPVLLVIVEHWVIRPIKYDPTYRFRETIFKAARPCSEVQQKVYRIILQEINQDGSKCYLIYSTALSYQLMDQMLESGEIERHLFPGSRVLKMAAINHDPVVGLRCSRGSGSYVLTHKVRNSINKMEFRSRESERIVSSNRDPLVIVKDIGYRQPTYHVLFCKLNYGRDGCSLNNKDSYSIYENCPKYELTALPRSWSIFMTLKSGEALRNVDYLYSKTGNVLVCADLYDQKYADKFSERIGIAVSTCYSVSILCLLATFLIHLRYPPLRTLPGLMLMNLIIALLLAQLIYVMNSFKLFASKQLVCKIMASAQHYFWLASFAWMLCLSFDIFQCFSATSSTVKTYLRTTYYKYMSVGWLVPILIPLTAIIMDNMDLPSSGYDSTVCWLSGTNSVLYLFALPVLSIVTINIVLFVGSVYRLGVLLKNAAYVGRKEDNKQRLIQCVKLSSWMGISWLFGIIPNVLDLKALWYVFAVTNAFQGVHIFFAFGITGRARVLMKKGHQAQNTTSVALSPSVPTVSSNVASE